MNKRTAGEAASKKSTRGRSPPAREPTLRVQRGAMERLARRASCRRDRCAGNDHQEDWRTADAIVSRGARYRAVLGMDRRPEARPRRSRLGATLRAAAGEERMVEDQPRESRG